MPTNVKIKGIDCILQSLITDGENGGGTWGSQYDWPGWQRPCIDLCGALGANCVKTYGPVNQVLAGGATAQQALQRFSQWIAYAQDHGLLVYLNLISLGQIQAPQPTISQIAAAAASMASIADRFANVIGLDIINEIDGTAYGSSYAAGNAALMQACAPAVRAVTSLPITFSNAISNPGGWADPLTEQISPHADFLDFHPYYSGTPADPSPSDLAGLRTLGYDKPILIGECGQAGGGDPTYAGIRTSRMNALGALSAQPDVMGVIAFALNDYDAGVNYGFTDENLTQPCRADYTVPFATWPAHL